MYKFGRKCGKDEKRPGRSFRAAKKGTPCAGAQGVICGDQQQELEPQPLLQLPRNALLGNGTEKEEVKTKAPKAYVEPETISIAADPVVQYMSRPQMEKAIERVRKQMQEAAKKLEFIEAAQYRDELLRLEDILKERWG